MDYLSLITSCIAIVVACISGLFSYYSSKRSAKVQAMQAYLAFLQHKMTKLEEGLKVADPKVIKKDDTNDYITQIIFNTSNHRKRIIPIYSYLLSEDRKEKIKEMVKTDAILDQMMGVINDKKQRFKYEGTLLEPEEIRSCLAGLNIQFKELIAEELEDTYKEFKGLSLMK